MRIVLFYHSLVSDWNHGNAHFLRGVAAELMALGHEVRVFEPRGGWSRANLEAEHGSEAVREFEAVFPALRSELYDPATLDLDEAFAGADLVLVHEWNAPELVRRIGAYRPRRFQLLFHDTHHRAVTCPDAIAAFHLHCYDGVLAYGEVLRQAYLSLGWARQAWTWHEAADVRTFRPAVTGEACEGDLVWIGNWGDEERTAELEEFFVRPVRELRLRASAYGVRYPGEARQALERAGIEYRGWIPNWRVPELLGRFRLTIHVPRRPYARALPGIPTIRVFEALACGAPLVSAPWEDAEHLFTAGCDYLVARDGAEMRQRLSELLLDGARARALGEHGRETILRRHTCAHRVDELLAIHEGTA